MNEKLPQGWVLAAIGEICRLVNGRAFKPSDWTANGLPIVRIQNLNNVEASFNHFDKAVDPRFLIDEGELLFAWSGTPGTSFGAHIWNRGKAILNQHIYQIHFDDTLLDKRFLRLAINSKLDYLIGLAHGGAGLAHVTKPMFEATEITLAPLAEQRRIVAKLEKLLGSIDAAQARLITIPRILKRFRQSVLEAAFKNQDEQNLKRLDEIFTVQTGGTPSRKNPQFYIGGTIPWVKTGEVQNCDIHRSEEFITQEALSNSNTKVFPLGTLLIAMYGEGKTRGQVGRLRIKAATNQACAALVNADLSETSNHYVFLFLLSQYYQLRAEAVGGNQPNLNLSIIKTWEVPFPSEREQQEIVRRVEALFKTADVLEARYRTAKAHVEKLTQSIVAKAFRGELVAQDENDEPAALLLERIKAQRASKLGQPRVVAIATRGTRGTKPRPHSKGIFYRRAALDCYVIEKLEGDPHLGRTKMEKISHLLQHHCGIDLEREPIRDAAGPNDYPSRINVESLARKQKWYTMRKREGGKKIDYLPGPEIQNSRHTAINFLGDRKKTVDAMLSILRPLDTKNIEVVATLYASWNDFLLTGKTPTDDELIHDVRNNWHPTKQLIPIEWWKKTLGWMRRKQLIPRGTGEPVPHKLLSEPSASPERLRRAKTNSSKKRKQRA